MEFACSDQHLFGVFISLLLDCILLGIDQLLSLDILCVLGLFDLALKRLLFVESIGLLMVKLILTLADSVHLFLHIDLYVHLVVSLFTRFKLALEVLHISFERLELEFLCQDFL